MTDLAALDFALRTAESVAFALHAVIGCTEALHGIGKHLSEGARKKLVSPNLFFPVAGFMLASVAIANFSTPELILCAQAYVIAFHTGGVIVHLKVEHHGVATVGPGFFIVLGFMVIWLRQSLVAALISTVVFGLVGVGLATLMVKPRENAELNAEMLS